MICRLDLNKTLQRENREGGEEWGGRKAEKEGRENGERHLLNLCK